MNRRAFLLGLAPVALVAYGQEPPDDGVDGPPPVSVHVVSMKAGLLIAPGIETSLTTDVRVEGARDMGTAEEAARLTLRRGKVEIVGVRRW